MCSILGLIDFTLADKFKNQKILDTNRFLKHRGPDDEGYYNDNVISLAFNRLSIIDLFSGNQPIIKEHIISIFNGEIYNFKEIRIELIDLGHKFLTNSDSEIIASAFLQWGISCVDKFNGMFAIAIYDKKKGKVFLIRDRVGIKPLYFSHLGEQLIFSSEIKGITNYPNFKKKLNFNALSSYLIFRYPHGEKNIFYKDVQKVKPGTFLEIDIQKKKFKEITYWSVPAMDTSKIKDEDYYLQKLDFLLHKSLKQQLVSDAPLGVFLSGGLDSSILSVLAAKNISGKLKTYSVGFKEKKYDESHKARAIAKYIGSEHTEVFVEKKDFLDNIEKIIDVKDVPLSIPHEYPLYLLCKKMKEDVKVVISGEGADEFFGGYSRVQNSPVDFIKANFLGKMSQSHFLKNIFSIDKNFDFKKKGFVDYFFHLYNWFTIEETNFLLSESSKAQIDLLKVKEPWTDIIKNHKKSNYYDQVLLMFQTNHLQCLLDRLDTMTMANSIEARVPFLDHELIEFINTVPYSFKVRWNSKFSKFKSLFSNNFEYSERYDTNKYLLRKIGKKYLPNSIAKEKKLGFPLPMNEWMQDKKIKDILLDKKSLDRNIFNKKNLEKFLSKNNSENDQYDFNGKKIWMMLNIELWMRKNID
jgi:asparagine synthase (glutamine-hydrolysing)